MLKKILLVLAALSGVAHANDDDAEAAARLVFGGGLSVVATGASVQIAYDPKGTLDDARVRDLVERYLEPAVFQHGSSPSFNADFQLNLVDYRPYARQGGTAWVMLEPLEKRAVCIDIAEQIVDGDRQKATVDWCWWEAARTARHTLHDFQGKPVTGADGKWNYDGALRWTTPMWKDDKLWLVVPGLVRDADVQAMRVQQNLLKYLDSDNRYLAQAQRLMAENDAWIAKRVAAVKALEKQQAGKGKKVVFGVRWFGPWDPVAAVTSVGDCQQVYWKAFATPKIKAGAVFVWQMSVDGTVCATDFIQDRWIAVGGPFYSGRADDCSAQLVTAGAHSLEVALYATKDQRTGRVVFDRNDTSFRDEIRSVLGKVVAKGAIACTNATDLTVRAAD